MTENFPEMASDGRMFYFTNADTIRLLLEVLLEEIKERKKGDQDEDKKINHSQLNLNKPFPLVFINDEKCIQKNKYRSKFL
jgi:hypothetical protein